MRPIRYGLYFFKKMVLKLTKPKWYYFKNRYGNDIKLYVNQNSNTLFKSMCKGDYDLFIYEKVDELKIPKNPVIWDVGSHIGYHVLNFASIVGPEGKVVAFEPNPFNRERITLHLDNNSTLASKVTVFDCALSDSEGEVVFSMTCNVDSGESSGGYITTVIPPLGFLSYRKFSNVAVKTKRGDHIVIDSPALMPDVVKIDVEGAEYVVLKGMVKILEEKQPVLFIEVHNILMMHYISEFLRKYNYTIQLLDEENATISRCFVVALPDKG